MRVAYTVLLTASTLLIIVCFTIIYQEWAQMRAERLVDVQWTTPFTTLMTTTTTTTTTEKPSNCPADGVWSEWSTIGHCPTTCGGCSMVTRTRTCTKLCGDCPCTGPSVDVGPCGLDLCPFPSAQTCCKPFKKSINYQTREFFCGTANIPGVTEIHCHA